MTETGCVTLRHVYIKLVIYVPYLLEYNLGYYLNSIYSACMDKRYVDSSAQALLFYIRHAVIPVYLFNFTVLFKAMSFIAGSA